MNTTRQQAMSQLRALCALEDTQRRLIELERWTRDWIREVAYFCHTQLDLERMAPRMSDMHELREKAAKRQLGDDIVAQFANRVEQNPNPVMRDVRSTVFRLCVLGRRP